MATIYLSELLFVLLLFFTLRTQEIFEKLLRESPYLMWIWAYDSFALFSSLRRGAKRIQGPISPIFYKQISMYLYTVKPVYNGHPRDPKFVAVVDR